MGLKITFIEKEKKKYVTLFVLRWLVFLFFFLFLIQNHFVIILMGRRVLVITAFCGRAAGVTVTKIAGIVGLNAAVIVIVAVVVAAGFIVVVVAGGVARLSVGRVTAATVHVAGQFSVQLLKRLFRFSWSPLTPSEWFSIAAVTVIVAPAGLGFTATVATAGTSSTVVPGSSSV